MEKGRAILAVTSILVAFIPLLAATTHIYGKPYAMVWVSLAVVIVLAVGLGLLALAQRSAKK